MWAGTMNVVQGCVPDPKGDVVGFISSLERAPSSPGRGKSQCKGLEVGTAEGRWETWVGVVGKWGDAGGMLHAGNDPFRVTTTPFLVPCGHGRGWVFPRPPLLNHHSAGHCHHNQAFLGVSPSGWNEEQALERRGQESPAQGCHLSLLSLTAITHPWDHPLPKLPYLLIHSFHPAIFWASENKTDPDQVQS